MAQIIGSPSVGTSGIFLGQASVGQILLLQGPGNPNNLPSDSTGGNIGVFSAAPGSLYIDNVNGGLWQKSSSGSWLQITVP